MAFSEGVQKDIAMCKMQRAAEKNAPIQTNNNAILSPFANIRLLRQF